MMLMKRAATVGVALLLTVSSSLAFGVAVRHIAWDGMVQGRGASKIRGLIEMVGGKVTGTTAVEVQYTGDAPGAARPWHVHVGSCAKGGAILGGANAYQSLTVDAKGAAKGKATLRVPLPESGSYYVNIHESSTSMGKIIACGDLLLAE